MEKEPSDWGNGQVGHRGCPWDDVETGWDQISEVYLWDEATKLGGTGPAALGWRALAEVIFRRSRLDSLISDEQLFMGYPLFYKNLLRAWALFQTSILHPSNSLWVWRSP